MNLTQSRLPNFDDPLTKWQACSILGVSPSTLKNYRKRGVLVEGVHYKVKDSTHITYYREPLEDWFQDNHS